MEVKVSDVAQYFWCVERSRLKILGGLSEPTTPEHHKGFMIHEWLTKRPNFRQPPTLKRDFAGVTLTGHPDDYKRPVDWKCEGCWVGFKQRCRFNSQYNKDIIAI